MLSKQDLIDFEQDIANIYATGIIHGPIHLRNGNEDQLIEIFKCIKQSDYVLSTWASHLHCLLHGVPPSLVKQQILDGKSITLNFPDYNFYSSAIVSGTVSIATGIGAALKRKQSNQKVWCFIGDMAVNTGAAFEAIRYCKAHKLPVTFVVEMNGVSVKTPIEAVWGSDYKSFIRSLDPEYVKYYEFKQTFPHSGIGRFVSF